MKIKHKAYIFLNFTVRNASRLDEPRKHLLYECYSAVFESHSWTKGSLEKVSFKSLLFNTMLYMWIHTCIYQSTTLTICKKILLGIIIVCGGSIHDAFKHNALHHEYNYKFQINLHVLYKADLLFTFEICSCYDNYLNMYEWVHFFLCIGTVAIWV